MQPSGQGEADTTQATRVLKPGAGGSSPEPVTPRPPSTRETPGTRTSVRPPASQDALLADELARMNLLARLMMLLSALGLGLVPTMALDGAARVALLASALCNFIAYAPVLVMTRRPAHYSSARMGVCAHAACLTTYALYYAFGPYSAAPMATVLPLFAYALGSSPGWTTSVWLHTAGAHALTAVALGAGWIEDRAMLPADLLVAKNQLLAECCVQAMFLLAFVLARRSRAKTVAALLELERAVRQVAERDALLAEVHHQLDVAAGLGAPGRFTEHVLGSYRLGVVIGRGGMGEVYEATHVERGEPAAVKLLARGALGDAGKVARFVRELDIARKLDAPNLVRVLEVGDLDAELPYLAMERLRGRDLAEILREQRRLPMAETLELAREVAAGLAAAHAAGIVHRDLKPSNVFQHQEGTRQSWKILDFGVGKLGGSGDLTREAVVGTPAYMAPEQARGAETDVRADVYALAVIVYRALTGRSLFGPSDVPAMLYRVVHTMPMRPGALATLPADVDLVLAIGLAKEPRDRFADAPSLAAALAQAARGELDEALREKARGLLERKPWAGSEAAA